MEDRQKICDLLLPALQATENLQDLESLEYDTKTELVHATFVSGRRKIAKAATNTGASMICNIILQIV